MNGSTSDKFRAANSPETDLADLISLGADEDEVIRAAVVYNPSSSKGLIYKMLEDKSELVQQAIKKIGFRPTLN